MSLGLNVNSAIQKLFELLNDGLKILMGKQLL